MVEALFKRFHRNRYLAFLLICLLDYVMGEMKGEIQYVLYMKKKRVPNASQTWVIAFDEAGKYLRLQYIAWVAIS